MKLNLNGVPAGLKASADEVLKTLCLEEGADGIAVEAVKGDKLKVESDGKKYVVTYDTITAFNRALTLIKANADKGEFTVEECKTPAELGVMLDCSRNAVRTVAFVKDFMRTLAAMGYNQLMLYTEDTYEIEGEPRFGYMRGRYTTEELTELDAFGAKIGIELVPCIQTLAHLNQIFRWEEYGAINDYNDILLIDDERTYALIEKMIATMRKAFRSHKIHIGMDEAHMVGRGRYEDLHGATATRQQLIIKHLKRVIGICEKYDFKPMMWSDMFFSLCFGGQYYPNDDAKLDVDALEGIPKNVRLVYWDYYHADPKFYDRMIKMHRQIGNEISFAGGAWTWNGFTGLNHVSEYVTKAAMSACKKNGLDKTLITMWGDNGAECSPLAVLPTLCMASETVRGNSNYSKIFKAVTGIAVKDFLSLDMANYDSGDHGKDCFENPCKYMLYNDPVGGLFDDLATENAEEIYRRHARKIASAGKRAGKYAYMFDTQRALCEVLSVKHNLGAKTRLLYESGDREGIASLVKNDYKTLSKKLKAFYLAFRKQWNTESKPFGFEVQDARLGGLMLRIEHCADILADYASGKIDSIPQFDETFVSMFKEENVKAKNVSFNHYARNVSTSVF